MNVLLYISSVHREVSLHLHMQGKELIVPANRGAGPPLVTLPLPQPHYLAGEAGTLPSTSHLYSPLPRTWEVILEVKKSKVKVMSNLNYCFCHILYQS